MNMRSDGGWGPTIRKCSKSDRKRIPMAGKLGKMEGIGRTQGNRGHGAERVPRGLGWESLRMLQEVQESTDCRPEASQKQHTTCVRPRKGHGVHTERNGGQM